MTNRNPEFPSDAATTRSVAENTPARQNLGAPVSATQADSKGMLVYSLGGTDASSFSLDTSTGQLKTQVVLDYEVQPTKTSYEVTISVTDGLDDYDNSDTAADDDIDVTITVTNIDVPDVPGAPTVNAAPGAAAGLSVSWTAVTATPTKPVDGYDVQYREEGYNGHRSLANHQRHCLRCQRHHHRAGVQHELRGAGALEEQRRRERLVAHRRGVHPADVECNFLSGTYTVTEGSSVTIAVNMSPGC